MTPFYYQHINLQQVHQHLSRLAVTPTEKRKLTQIVFSIIDHEALFIILENLPKEEHQLFLSKFTQDPEDESLFEVESVKDQLQMVIDEIIDELKDF